ncbi:MAG: Protein kinase C-like 1 [Geoglossum umbratile]|nr:MAG: Protein kinase C-like 1 [Geoglossum umbratile]
MASRVNKTSLHPGGVVPSFEHTEIEEELHERANIDYDRVDIISNPSVAALYEDALVHETGSAIVSSGALSAYSGEKTGRSPLDKRIVREGSSEGKIWWGPVNKAMTPEVWRINRERAIDYLNTRDRIYVVDGFAGWDERYRLNIRVVCARAYHALFMRTMLIRPSEEELTHFHPDYVIYNAGAFPANRYTEGMTSATSVAINFGEMEMVILGTEYAGEMKKGILTVFFYEMPVKHGVLTLHSSANVGEAGDVTVFLGLTGTGKTALSADPRRALIGDDEHCWSDRGIFNIEGGVREIYDPSLKDYSAKYYISKNASVTPNALDSLRRKSPTFTAQFVTDLSSKMWFLTRRLVLLITTMEHSRRTLGGEQWVFNPS